MGKEYFWRAPITRVHLCRVGYGEPPGIPDEFWNASQSISPNRCSNGSRLEGVAAGPARTQGSYLGEYGTVMDAEMLDMVLVWENGKRIVALDSQPAIQESRT